ncbi:MAG: acetyl/propionyl/methylcrotonyl-CoA carboxylase subunit alpha [Bacilli bacterium]
MKKILIANRGEIAVRIIRACHQEGFTTVAVYSTVDAESLHVTMADESVCIGDHKLNESYLNMERIISAAIVSEADAIHPGYGFLSENDQFANLCEKCGIEFIGPKSETITLMGNKANARDAAIKSGVPVVKGSKGIIKDFAHLQREMNKIGYPVLIKATHGGGGRGMRIVYDECDLEISYNTCVNEAKNAFGNGDVYIEQFVINPKHIEVQILADKFGNVVTLGERDCSMQRRNQKVIEETPCKLLSDKTRNKLFDVSANLAKEIGYIGAGTIEYVMDENENFYFIEMNTRIQVEHPISEEVSNVDLVAWQLLIANGEKLAFTQEDIELKNHSIECRVTCEDISRGFMPVPGQIDHINIPGGNGVRVDTFIYQGCTISKYYDSMILKVIVKGNSRLEAINKMKQALCELVIEPIPTNIEFLYEILEREEFANGKYHTKTLERLIDNE